MAFKRQRERYASTRPPGLYRLFRDWLEDNINVFTDVIIATVLIVIILGFTLRIAGVIKPERDPSCGTWTFVGWCFTH